jgi:hypothetical protein
MADASESWLNIDAPVEKRGRGRPRGSKNKTTAATMGGIFFCTGEATPRPSGWEQE